MFPFLIIPPFQDRVDEGIRSSGSNLSGVSAKCSWTEKTNELNLENSDDFRNPPMMSEEGLFVCFAKV